MANFYDFKGKKINIIEGKLVTSGLNFYGAQGENARYLKFNNEYYRQARDVFGKYDNQPRYFEKISKDRYDSVRANSNFTLDVEDVFSQRIMTAISNMKDGTLSTTKPKNRTAVKSEQSRGIGSTSTSGTGK